METNNLTFREQLILKMLEDTLKTTTLHSITNSRILLIHRIADALSNRPEQPETLCDESITSKPIAVIGMHSHAYRALIHHDIRTIGDLLQLRQNDILRIHGFGRKALAQIEDYLEENGLELQR